MQGNESTPHIRCVQFKKEPGGASPIGAQSSQPSAACVSVSYRQKHCVLSCHIPYVLDMQPQQVELVEGYGVYLTKRQLDEAVDQSCNSPSRLIRNLLMVFFTPSVMASSSCLGTRKFPALNNDIIGACFSKAYMYINVHCIDRLHSGIKSLVT